MAITKPYYGIYRPFVSDKDIDEYDYLTDPSFFASTKQHIMAFFLIVEDLKKVFEYIEPINAHDNVYSHRLFELLLFTCTEIESILSELLNLHDYRSQKGINPQYNLTMRNYFEIGTILKLSQYTVSFRESRIIIPYEDWNETDFKPLRWYSGYNSVKHNRSSHFADANLKNVLESIAGLYALLYSQFYFHADHFQDEEKMVVVVSDKIILTNPPYYKLFSIKQEPRWTDTEKYDFNWSAIKNDADRFQKLTF